MFYAGFIRGVTVLRHGPREMRFIFVIVFFSIFNTLSRVFHQEILARAEESPNFNGVAHRLLWRELHRLNAIRSRVRIGWGWGLEGYRISIVANTWNLKLFKKAILKGWISIGSFQIFGG